MKCVLHVLISLSFNFSFADFTAQPAEKNLADCASVTPIAVLAKDNIPYWSESDNSTQKKSCYNALREVLENGSEDQIRSLEEAFDGQVRFFINDKDFSEFINTNKMQQSFTVEATTETLLPVQRPKTFFFRSSSIQ